MQKVSLCRLTAGEIPADSIMRTSPCRIVLDTTMGVGSTGVAALQVGRQFVGIELEDEFYQVAVERMEKIITT